MTPRRPAPTACSDGDSPSRSALVESQISASTPASPSARKRASSVIGPISGRRIELPVAGVDDRAERRGDGERHRLGDRVADRDRLDLERADRERLAGAVDRDRDFRRAVLALALGFEQAGGERRHPDRRLQPRPEVEQRAVVVLMRMGDDDAAQVGDAAPR